MPRTDRTSLTVHSLEARDVPATIDLSTVGSFGVNQGAIFEQAEFRAHGHSSRTFLAIDGRGVEQGVNAPGRRPQFDELGGARAISFRQIPVVFRDGVAYREFRLDANQNGRRPLVSLDELRLYVGSQPNLRGYDAATKTFAGKQAVYDMDAAGDTTVIVRDGPNRHRHGDAVFLIPDAVFAGADRGDFVYLYSRFGDTVRANGGAEFWSVRRTNSAPAPGPANPPPPVAGSLSGFVYYDDNNTGAKDPGEPGIEGAIIVLYQLNEAGEYVEVARTLTGADGSYTFSDLAPGTYGIQEFGLPIVEGRLIDGFETIGSLGGNLMENDFFGGIVMPSGGVGLGYNFAETQGF